MYDIIFLIAFILLAVILAIFGLLKGKRNLHSYAISKLISTAVSAIASAFLSIFAARGVAALIYIVVMKIGVLGSFSSIFDRVASAKDTVTAIIAMLIAPLLSIVIFFILKAIANTIIKSIIKVIQRSKLKAECDIDEESPKKKRVRGLLKREKCSVLSMLCGASCGIIISLVIMIPLVGIFSLANDVMTVVKDFVPSPIINTVAEVTDGAANNAASKVISVAGGKQAFDLITTQNIGKAKMSLSNEINVVTSAGNAISAVKNKNVSRDDAAVKVLALESSFSQSTMLPILIPEVLTCANQSWDNGESFMGIKKPSFGNADSVVDPLMHTFANSNPETLKKDVATVVHIAAELVKQDALSSATANPMKILENEELSTVIIYEVLSNDHLSPLIEDVSDYSVGMLCNKMNVKINNLSLHLESVDDKQTEAKSLANALFNTLDLMNHMGGGASLEASTIKDIGPLLDSFAATTIIGHDNTEVLLSGLLESEKVYSSIGFTLSEATDLANTINDSAPEQGYTPLMRSLSQMVDVVKLSSDKTKTVAEKDKVVETLLSDLTPASAKVLQATTSASMMESHGVPANRSDKASEMVSDVFGKLSTAKENGMSEEQYKAEASATSNLINVAMNADKNESETFFGEEGAVGKDANTFVDEIISSSVISETIVESVYENGEESDPILNPLGINKDLNENERQEFRDAMNNKWNNATEEEKADESYRQKYVALCSMLNIEATVTDSEIIF